MDSPQHDAAVLVELYDLGQDQVRGQGQDEGPYWSVLDRLKHNVGDGPELYELLAEAGLPASMVKRAVEVGDPTVLSSTLKKVEKCFGKRVAKEVASQVPALIAVA